VKKEMILISYSKHTGMLGIKETFFNSDNESLFLTQPGCNCFSVKYELDNKLWIHAILEGEDAEGNDIMIHKSSFGLKNNGV
jgi:hypothetical protein